MDNIAGGKIQGEPEVLYSYSLWKSAPKNIYHALGIRVSVRRPCDAAGHVVGRRVREGGHLLPTVTLALEKEGNQSLLFLPPGIRWDYCPSLQEQLCWSLRCSDADLKN